MRHYPFTSSPPSSFTIIIISSFTHCFNHYNNTLSYASPPLPFTISFTIVIAIYIPHHISIPPPPIVDHRHYPYPLSTDAIVNSQEVSSNRVDDDAEDGDDDMDAVEGSADMPLDI